ncbi:Glu-tRNA(Gln) amidotransferase GatDE subunit D [Candidatus Pacearchaeota archaeon CG06_land_8_20_14_3_00_35_12]|nr:MAG: Glu-tRNA(Gln) amidotransferase GatDE subunit D [Candidatus Pacearchaeota archaeon CG06_land_8_20_14_3_00_35_12]
MAEAKTGDLIEIKTSEEVISGFLLESHDSKIILIKLKSGYNQGISKSEIKSMKILESYKHKEEKSAEGKQNKEKKGLPKITILHTGGTIASKVDYRTGAVSAKISAKEILEMFPELGKIANIDARVVFQMFSEDMEPEHWLKLAEEVKKEIGKGADGIIITHGTDTLHHTGAALSFMIQDSPIPIILTASQRSSDRGSSDSFLNLICAIKFAAESDFSGVAICMHSSSEDKECAIMSGTKCRKLHTSRRDAFKPVNSKPIALVTKENIRFLTENYIKRDKKRKPETNICFNDNIALIKAHPGFKSKELSFCEDYDGIIFEGTGLGHLGINVLDEITKDHAKMLEILKKFNKQGKILVMTSQCIFGRVNMNVYSTGRDLLEAGVISGKDMSAETAFVKLGWLLGQKEYKKNIELAKQKLQENLVGEFNDRLSEEEFL